VGFEVFDAALATVVLIAVGATLLGAFVAAAPPLGAFVEVVLPHARAGRINKPKTKTKSPFFEP
jgi:hypothetical protein